MGARRILAACDMAAERRRAAALDRAHYLELVEAHMAAVGLAPSGPVVAEDVRDLQSGSSHNGRLLRRRLLGASPRRLAARRAQTRERALDLGDDPCRHAGVASRRVELLVSEQRLDQPNVLAVLEQMGCEGMAQRMKSDRLAQPRGFRRLLEQSAELARSRGATIDADRCANQPGGKYITTIRSSANSLRVS